VEHHDDNTHTVHHVHKKHGYTGPDKGEGDVRGAAGDHDAMMDHMMDHTSMPNAGEDQDEHGAAMAAPAAAAMPPAGPAGA
jgi:hypothetical protein